MEEESKRLTLRLDADLDRKVDDGYKRIGCRSRAEFAKQAIQFFYGYITADDCREYLPHVIVSTMKGVLGTMENRMAAILFKEAVTNAMIVHILAATHKIDPKSLSALRGLCVDEVKSINGALAMEDVVRFDGE